MTRFLPSLLLAAALGASLSAAAQSAANGSPSLAPPARGLIVKLKSDPGVPDRERPQLLREQLAAVAQDTGVAMHGNTAIGSGHHLMRFAHQQRGQALDAAMRRLRLHPDVESVEPDVLLPLAQVAPNDAYYVAGRQEYLKGPATYRAGVNLPPAWARNSGGTGGVVAVLDTGIRFSHPDLQGRLLAGYDFISELGYSNDPDGRDPDPSDPGDWITPAENTTRGGIFEGCGVQDSSWHGTFIAGQISAQTNNVIGVAGVNGAGKVLPVRVSGKCGAYLSDILDGMRWAAGLPVAGVPNNPNPARIINLSFGGDKACSDGPSYQDTINEVTAAGTLVVVAAGNFSKPATRPADCRNVVAVGAVQEDGRKASYSNYGPTLSLMAPGGTSPSAGTSTSNLFSTSNDGLTGPGGDIYGYKLGTSFSTPLVSGVASLMLALNPALTPAQLAARLRASARPHVTGVTPSCSAANPSVCTCTTATCGAGLLDADGATLAALDPAVLIAGVGTPAGGTTLTLDGRASAASLGSAIATYRWTQVAGPALAIQDADKALAKVVLPVGAASYQFKLVVTDTATRASEELLSVTSTTGQASGGGGGGDGGGTGGGGTSGGGGGGSMGWLWGAGLWLAAALAWRRRKAA